LENELKLEEALIDSLKIYGLAEESLIVEIQVNAIVGYDTLRRLVELCEKGKINVILEERKR